MSGVGKTWRIIGLLLTIALYYLAMTSDGLLAMAGFGFVGLAVFFGSWSVAAWFDVQAKVSGPSYTSFPVVPNGGSLTVIPACCSETRPHVRQDYGEGRLWVSEDVR